MCGLVGFCNLNYDISSSTNVKIFKVLYNTLSHSCSDEDDIYISKHINLGHKRFTITDTESGKQPMICKYEDNTYTIVYNGQLYNANEVRNELINYGYEFNRF